MQIMRHNLEHLVFAPQITETQEKKLKLNVQF